MRLKQKLMPCLARVITSHRLLLLQRHLHEGGRKILQRPHQATFYFRIDDPYSVLLAQVLPDFARHFGINIIPRVMLYLDPQMYPAAGLLSELAPRDAVQLASLHDLHFPSDWQLPNHEASLAATCCLLQYEQSSSFWDLATSLSAALWSADKSELATLLDEHGKLASDDAQKRLRARRDHFLDEGHYLTGTLHYAGEWYWSIERLDHLAGRLNDMGMGNRIWPLAYGRAKQARLEKVTVPTKTRDLTLYFSFRSPYSYLALARTYALVDHYGLTLHIRPVLPMVMRGLAVPGAKRFYILRDAAREARLHNIPFGKICDPVGIGVERCMAIWPLAEKVGRLPQWLHTAATGIWSKGIDTASDKGLKSLVEKAGLDWNDARLWLNDDSWRQRAEANRVAMMKAGNWGVPSFQLDEDMVWGQDRFAVIEASLFAESR